MILITNLTCNPNMQVTFCIDIATVSVTFSNSVTVMFSFTFLAAVSVTPLDFHSVSPRHIGETCSGCDSVKSVQDGENGQGVKFGAIDNFLDPATFEALARNITP